MGMTIELTDQDYQYCKDYASGKTNTMALNNINSIIKAIANGTQYENRLKADMVAILVELQLEIDELPNHELQSSDWKQGFTHGLADVQEKVIQKKINELKEKDNGK